MVSASAPDVPKPLIKQLKINGTLVITIGTDLYAITKTKKGIKKEFIGTMFLCRSSENMGTGIFEYEASFLLVSPE